MIKNEEPLLEIIIPNFITEIQVSKSRKEIYYELGGKHLVPPSKEKHVSPKGNKKFEWKLYKVGTKIKTLLFDINTNSPIVKNSRVAGKPRFKQVKGQDFYSGFGHFTQRIQVIEAIKNNFKEYFKGKKIREFPVRLEFIYYNELNTKNSKGKNTSQDGDNLNYPYSKSGQDLMKAMNIIPDDNLLFIRKSSWEFIESLDKKLIIKAYKYYLTKGDIKYV